MSILTQIGTSGIKANAVTTDKILDEAVTTPKIADGDITSAKLDANAAFVPGMILMWSGTILTIPTGWGLCDGTTYAGSPSIVSPDLRDKFVIGANQDDSSIAKTNITGSLTQTGGSKNNSLTDHFHHIRVLNSASGAYYGWVPKAIREGDNPRVWYTAGASGSFSSSPEGSHPIAKTGSGDGTDANLPPYYSIAYIIKKPT